MSDVNALRQAESATFFVELLERLNGNYAGAAALFALLSRQADLAFIPVSNRELSARLGACVPARTLFRALLSLDAMGLIQSETHRNTTTRYCVNVDALHALLAKPMAQSEVIPGLTPLPKTTAQNGEPKHDVLVRRFEPLANSTSSPEFMVGLLYRLGQDYPTCAVLYALLARQAGFGFVKASRRDLSAALCARVSPAHVDRVLATLESINLIERQVVSKKDVRYRVDADALRSLLAQPVSPAEVIPGLTPLPALQRLFVAPAPSDSLETFRKGAAYA